MSTTLNPTVRSCFLNSACSWYFKWRGWMDTTALSYILETSGWRHRGEWSRRVVSSHRLSSLVSSTMATQLPIHFILACEYEIRTCIGSPGAYGFSSIHFITDFEFGCLWVLKRGKRLSYNNLVAVRPQSGFWVWYDHSNLLAYRIPDVSTEYSICLSPGNFGAEYRRSRQPGQTDTPYVRTCHPTAPWNFYSVFQQPVIKRVYSQVTARLGATLYWTRGSDKNGELIVCWRHEPVVRAFERRIPIHAIQ